MTSRFWMCASSSLRFSYVRHFSSTTSSFAKPFDKLSDPKPNREGPEKWYQRVIPFPEPSADVRDGVYHQNQEYVSGYSPMTFYDVEVEMKDKRLPQPSAGSKPNEK